MQVKLTGNSSDQRTNEDGTHLVYKSPPGFPGTSSSTSNKSESELQKIPIRQKKLHPLRMFVGLRVRWDRHRSPPPPPNTPPPPPVN